MSNELVRLRIQLVVHNLEHVDTYKHHHIAMSADFFHLVLAEYIKSLHNIENLKLVDEKFHAESTLLLPDDRKCIAPKLLLSAFTTSYYFLLTTVCTNFALCFLICFKCA